MASGTSRPSRGDQTTASFRQGEQAIVLLKEQSITSIKQAEALGLEIMTTLADVVAPMTPRLPSLVPAGGLDTVVKAGFDVTQQLLATQRKLAEHAVELVIRQTT